MHYLLVFLSFLSFVCSQECSKDKRTAHTRLNEDLLCGYEKTVRPKLAKENATIVNVRIILKSLAYDMDFGALTVNSWLAVIWKDDHLVWNPSDYEDIKLTHLNSDNIWIPDLSIYNRINEIGNPSALDVINCLVFNTGQVVCIPPTQHEALCVPDLSRFPFDTQNCTLRFGSWVHSGEEIDFRFTTPPVTTEDYMESGEWKLVTVNATKTKGNFSCCPDNTYPSLVYNFIIERHSGPEICIAIVPALVLIMVTLVTFCISFEELERIVVIGLNLILHILYIQYIAWLLPRQGPQPPLIVIFSRDSFILSAFQLILTILEKKCSKLASVTPPWISQFAGVVINSKPGRVFFLFDHKFKKFANKIGEDDEVNMIENTENPTTDWTCIAHVIDRLCFIIYAIIYFCMFIAFVP